MDFQHQATKMKSMRSTHIVGLVLLIGFWLSQDALADTAIAPGSEALARAYYVHLSKDVGFNAIPAQTTLDSLVAFAGYQFTGEQLRSLDPAVLMSPASVSVQNGGQVAPSRSAEGTPIRHGDILATRFFAPKIVNISKASPTLGWRKLIRLRVRPNSAAARAQIESIIILFNFLAPATEKQPFSGLSFNTQVMLIAPNLKDQLYWLDFNPDGTLGLKLNASFDAANSTDGSNTDYFVPDGCNACHGSPGNHAHAMVNYLDTDHWFDRLENDFVALKSEGTPLVFDAGTNDSSQASYAHAFDLIRQFNEEAVAQNAAVQPQSFETLAAHTWLTLHAHSDQHFPPVARGFSTNGGPVWQPSEAEGLGMLNRFCFRCHGSVRFSVFDRPTVVKNAGNMRQRIQPSLHQAKIPGFKMPPDRVMDASEIKALNDFLKSLK